MQQASQRAEQHAAENTEQQAGEQAKLVFFHGFLLVV